MRIKPRLHQGNMLRQRVPDQQLVSGYIYVDEHMLPGNKLLVRDTCWLYIGDKITLLFIYVTVDLYPFVSSNRRVTNWQQFCRRYKKHVDGDRTQVADNLLPVMGTNYFKSSLTTVVNYCFKK